MDFVWASRRGCEGRGRVLVRRGAAALYAVLAMAATATAQLRVVNYNVASLNGDADALRDVFAALNDDDWPGFAVAPHVYVIQEVKVGEESVLLTLLNRAAPAGVTYAMATYTNLGEDGAGGAQALYYRTDVLAEDVAGHLDLDTGAGRKSDRWKLDLVGYGAPAASFYAYGSHLKASQGFEGDRLVGATVLRTNADALPAGSHVIFAGDYNFYDNGEPGYLEMLSTGAGQAVDPLGSGSWAGGGNAMKHSQSPRASASGGLVGGGLDDRFDLQLSTQAFHDGLGLSLLPGTYRSVGNDGNHYNLAINDGTNGYYAGDSARSNALADDLHEAADHLPVVADYQIPALIGAALPLDGGRVIVGGTAHVFTTITNDVDVVTVLGGDILEFDAVGTGVLGGGDSGTLAPLAAPRVIPLPVDTSVVGVHAGGVSVSSTGQGVGNNPATPATTVTVLRHARPSFHTGQEDIETDVLWENIEPDSGAVVREVMVHNLGFDDLQALLDLDAATPLAPPFALTGGLVSNIGDEPATLEFTLDTTALAAGDYEATSFVFATDEDLPGEGSTILTLNLLASVSDAGTPGDVDGDGEVTFDDLLAVLANWGDCPPPPAECLADVDGSGEVDFGDLLTVLANWG